MALRCDNCKHWRDTVFLGQSASGYGCWEGVCLHSEVPRPGVGQRDRHNLMLACPKFDAKPDDSAAGAGVAPDDESGAAKARMMAAINKRDERIEAVRLWFAEWEMIIPPDAREAFRAAMPWADAHGVSVPSPSVPDQPTPAPLEAPSQSDSVHLTSAASETVQAALPEEIRAIIERLHTQDNRITQDPLFAVQQKRTIGGLDRDYASAFAWVCDEGIEAGAEQSKEFDALYKAGESIPDGYRRVGYVETWEFVTGCLTEQGCKDYIACNGHNLKEPRIYAYGSYRNGEFIALRKWLMSLRGVTALAACDPVAGAQQPNEKESPAQPTGETE